MSKKEVVVDKIELQEVMNELRFNRKELTRTTRELEIFNGMLQLGLRIKKGGALCCSPDSLSVLEASQREIPEDSGGRIISMLKGVLSDHIPRESVEKLIQDLIK